MCVRGGMELSRDMAERLNACFVAKSEDPEDLRLSVTVGGRWYCPGCGVPMKEEVSGVVRCPQCGRNLGKFLFHLVELHPHSPR